MTELFLKAKSLIEKANYIALSTHEKPDLDGLGSLLALEAVLRDMGKTTYAFSTSPISESMKILPHQSLTKKLDPEKIDLVIGLDYGSPERLEILQAYPEIKANFLSFDHHAVGRHLGFKIVDGAISSTSEIIHNFINFLGAPADRTVALCLLAGIMDDTGAFRYANTSAQTLKAAGELMLKGASLAKISQASGNLNLDEKFSALNEVFDRIQTGAKTELVFAVIDNELFERLSAGLNEIGMASILSAAPEAKIAATITEKTPGIFDVSLRSQQDRGVDVARLAAAFGGGGHRLAAAFRSTEMPEKIVAKIEQLFSTAAKLND